MPEWLKVSSMEGLVKNLQNSAPNSLKKDDNLP